MLILDEADRLLDMGFKTRFFIFLFVINVKFLLSTCSKVICLGTFKKAMLLNDGN